MRVLEVAVASAKASPGLPFTPKGGEDDQDGVVGQGLAHQDGARPPFRPDGRGGGATSIQPRDLVISRVKTSFSPDLEGHDLDHVVDLGGGRNRHRVGR